MDTHEASIYTAVLITALVLGCTILYFAYTVFRQQRKYIQMQRIYFTKEINLLEKERNRVARDLHDELGVLLSMAVSSIQQIKSGSEHPHLLAEKADDYIQQAVRRMGQIAINLTPTALTKKGLKFTIERFFEALQEVCAIRFYSTYEVKDMMPPAKSIHLYRIVQEVCNNAIKHSQATQLEIRFKQRKNKIYIWCKDNGIGFNIDKTDHQREGLGLNSIRSRTEILNGQMKCTSDAQNGTEYFFEFPIQ